MIVCAEHVGLYYAVDLGRIEKNLIIDSGRIKKNLIIVYIECRPVQYAQRREHI